MRFSEMFSNLDREKVEKVIRKYGISIPDDFNFSATNILIGPNGAGKTRFLSAIRELYLLDGSTDVLYGYIPSLSDRSTTMTDKQKEPLPEWTLSDFLYMENVNFSDFFIEIEKQGEDFISEILQYHSQQQKKRSMTTLDILKKSFSLLTNKELHIVSGNVYVNDKIEGNSKIKLSEEIKRFSPGELMLFYMSIFLSLQGQTKRKRIIILDEPESHLHPKALISFIKMLVEICASNEIWIATHSLYLLPQFKFENVIYIDKGLIQKRSSSIYQNILSDVLGDEDGNISLFLSSIDEWQYCDFIAECFTNPTVVDIVNSNDEQVQLFIKYFEEHRPFRILDCGGGSGRLGLSFEAAKINNSENLIYDIYDKSPTYSGDKYSVYTKLSNISSTYNCVVMMNFLHEVNPAGWVQLFRKLYSLMEENAYLLFVEVSTLTKGEMPNAKGYFILGKMELEFLFDAHSEIIEVRKEDKQKSSCFLISKKRLMNISEKSILDAILCLKERTQEEIRKIRNDIKMKQGSQGGARRYAFLLQQYINADLFIDDYHKKESAKIKRNQKRIGGSKTTMLEIETDKNPANQKGQGDCFLKISTDKQKQYIKDLDRAIQYAKNCLVKTGKAPQTELQKCWKMILSLEKNHVEKGIIAQYLVKLASLGDERARKHLNNNGYNKYLSTL